MKIFMENKQKIAKHNTRFHKGHHNYQLEPDSLVPLTFHPPMFNCPKMLTGVLQVL